MRALLRILPIPDAGEGRLRFGLRLLVVALCAVTLLQAMRPAVYSVRAGVSTVADTNPNSGGRVLRERLEYVSDEIHRQVPAGSRVVIADQDPEWRLRLAEFATLWGAVVVTSGGDVEILRENDPAAPHGVRLVVRKPVAA